MRKQEKLVFIQYPPPQSAVPLSASCSNLQNKIVQVKIMINLSILLYCWLVKFYRNLIQIKLISKAVEKGVTGGGCHPPHHFVKQKKKFPCKIGNRKIFLWYIATRMCHFIQCGNSKYLPKFEPCFLNCKIKTFLYFCVV